MQINEILVGIDAEITRLQEARRILTGAKNTGTTTFKRRQLSPEARARIAAGQKARWAKAKKAR
jgi:hypothetical protein